MDIEKLKKFIDDPRLCSSTEKCAVAYATENLSVASWCDSLEDAWACLDEEQKGAVQQYRKANSK